MTWWLVAEIALVAVGLFWIRRDLAAGRRRTWLLAVTVAVTVCAGVALGVELLGVVTGATR